MGVFVRFRAPLQLFKIETPGPNASPGNFAYIVQEGQYNMAD
jgi:hypothetical protein